MKQLFDGLKKNMTQATSKFKRFPKIPWSKILHGVAKLQKFTQWFQNMKIGVKLLGGFIFVALLAGAIGLIGSIHLRVMGENEQRMCQKNTIPLYFMGLAVIDFEKLLNNMKTLVIVDSDQEIYISEIEALDRSIQDAVAKFQKDGFSIQADSLTFALKKFDEYQATFIDLIKAKQKKQALELMNGDLKSQAQQVESIIKNIYDMNVSQASQTALNDTKAANQAGYLMMIIAIIGMLIAIGLGILFAMAIGRPVKRLTGAAERLALGDTEVEVVATSTDEIGQLIRSFIKMVDNIREQASVAQRVAAGDLTVEVVQKSEQDILALSMKQVVQSLHNLNDEVTRLTGAAMQGRLDTRADGSGLGGDFRKIIEGVNKTLDTVVGNFEAIPAPIQFMDSQLRIQYINQTGADFVGKSKEELVGKNCADLWQSTKCGTRECPCQVAMEQNSTYTCSNDAMIGDHEVSIFCAAAPLKNDQGEVVGSFEFMTDQTAITKAMRIAEKVNQFQKDEVAKLVQGLGKLAAGDLDFTIEAAPGDADTFEVRQNFVLIHQALHQSIAAIQQLIADTDILVQAATAGQLEVRVDAARHGGDFGKIVAGINRTLDAIVEPLNDANQVLRKIGMNDFTLAMDSEKYQGMLRQFAKEINEVRSGFLGIQEIVVAVSQGDTARFEEGERLSRRSENDQLLPAINTMMQTIRGLIQEVTRLTESAINGDLKVRGEAARFTGGYQQIVTGFNQTLDAVIQPVNEAASVLEEIGKGNLAVQVQGDYRGDHRKIADALNQTIKTLNEVLGEFGKAADQVASGARHVSDSSQVLSQAATEQASTVQQITASMAEIADQTRQNATHASQANQLALAAKEQAIQGDEQMLAMLTAMTDINEASRNISKIIKVIDEIAFQTNILALNAAVEAARAGQHGKGFAVVAEEVRNLAGRSANAAKETTTLIEGSMKKVATGTKIANQTADALNRIVEGVTKATSLVGGIAESSNEQATAITQVNQGISQVARVTQTNTATAEASASASEEMASQADLLRQIVQKFKLRGEAEHNRHSAAPDQRSKKGSELARETIAGGLRQAAANSEKSRKPDAGEFGKY
ncbi:methyl-accepting chemotaxis sensory transducer with Pas/Pac sensor [Hydrogenispora ethanolica]|uniref:Methyl-accepting chemotaxis sensory transducer with Pas/Pac sensor n=2 Tax=Hydrogenispora ethanolica TaxID=1082276 RepID=A0A4R1R1P8_HYDET|nr:methyl-accepting chemotaxis sensory transducer with Pas/Pac sensor [Hydrogenispora ethanolica]